MFEAYHVLLPFPNGMISHILKESLLKLKENSKSYQLDDNRVVFYTGETPTEDAICEAADRLEREDSEG